MQENNSLELSCQFEFITESNIKIAGLSNINESLSIHYLIYRIDNIKNSKHYIGQHYTKNPLNKYMGSGNLIQAAVEKYGIENFIKTILFDFDNFEEMNEKEKELIPLSACYSFDKMSYNIREGGSSGQMSDITKEKLSKAQTLYQQSLSNEEKEQRKLLFSNIWNNKTQHEKDQIIEKCSISASGSKNPMYRKNWKDYSTPEKIELHKLHISQVTARENNPMYNKSIKDHMTPEKYQQWREKHKKQKGENHPCYGTKMLYDLNGNRRYIKIDKVDYYLLLGWKPSKIETDKNRIKDKSNPAYGRKWLRNPQTDEVVYVKSNEVESYLAKGFVFGYGKRNK